MLNRLISNLPFNPSLVEELSFYSKRLRREQSIRRLGFILIILSMLVQVFAASVPAEKSLAYAPNNIIGNGAQTKQDILRAWNSPETGVAKIYSAFGVTIDDINALPDRPNARIKSNASNFWSIGRNSLSGYSNVEQQYKNQQIAVQTTGPTVYLKPLRAWDTSGHPNVYDAFRGTNSTTHETFWILADCGNYVQNGSGRLPAPNLEARKTIVGDRNSVKPGGIVKFRIEYRNKQTGSLAEDVKIIDNLQRDKFSIISPDNLPIGSDDKLEKNIGNLSYTDQSNIFDITVKVKNNLKNGVQICNSVRLTAANAQAATGGGPPDACIKVSTSSAATQTAASTPVTFAAASTRQTEGSDMPPGLAKEVKNITRNLSGQAAINSTVHPGDVIEYGLTTYNGRPENISNYEIKDYVGDITDYANIDLGFLSQKGGTYNDKTKEVIWTKQNLLSKQDNVKRFRIKIKSPIPSTNRPTNASTSFDCKISNEYGNEISMGVQCPVTKSIETLPNTGPGAAVAITFGLASFSGYFLLRNGLIGKELFIIKRNYATTGGKE